MMNNIPRTGRRLFWMTLVMVLLAAALPSAAANGAIVPTRVSTGARASHAAPVADPGPPAIEFVSSLGGPMSTFVVSDTMAYVVEAGALTVLDVSNPAAPARLAHVRLVRSVSGIRVVGTIVYVLGAGVLQIIDVANPLAPIELSRYTTQTQASSIQLDGSMAYLAGSFSGIEVVDVSDPAHPTLRTQYPPTFVQGEFVIAGGLLYMVDSRLTFSPGVLQIFDVSNPDTPILRHTFSMPKLQIIVPPSTHFDRVVVEGSRIYIAASVDGKSHLITLELSNSGLTLLGNVAVDGTLITVAGNIAYMRRTTGSALVLLDVTDPANPAPRANYALDFTAVQVVGDLVYVLVFPWAGLHILDVSTPENIHLRGSFMMIPSLRDANDIEVIGNFAYVLGDGLQIIDLTNPISPTLRGAYLGQPAQQVNVFGTRAYLFGGGEHAVIDISNLDLLTRIGIIPKPALGHDIAVAEAQGVAYVLGFESMPCDQSCPLQRFMLRIIDMQAPATPVVRSSIALFETQSIPNGDVVVNGRLAYVRIGGILKIVDVSNPAKPVLLGSYTIPDGAADMQIVGNYAYLVGPNGFILLDLSNPAQLAVRGRYFNEVWYYLDVKGDLAYVAGERGLAILDISNPALPLPLARYTDAQGTMQVVENLMYVVDRFAGLHILRAYPERFSPPVLVPRGFLPLVR